MSVYLLPYFRYYYYDAYVAYFGINDLQMGMLGSIYGALAIIGYCLGGWVADRVSLKLAISGSLIVTGASAIILLMKPVFPIHVAIYGLWGVTSILTFWNPCMKALRALCKPEEQGRGYALFDMVRGMLNFPHRDLLSLQHIPPSPIRLGKLTELPDLLLSTVRKLSL